MRELSERQDRMLRFIGDYLDEHGRPPTVREIGHAAGISSTSVVDYNLRVLERDGLLKRDRELSRGIDLVNRRRPNSIRVVGLIAAGEPIEAIDDGEDVVEVSQRFVQDGCYALRVKGTSMIEDQIDDGDIVVVRPQATADDGDTVVALVTSGPSLTGAATLKRLYREPDRIRLQPRNAALSPIYVNPGDLTIQGKVVSVIKNF
ncbi:MAG: transcriptional repressor LexA [Chloroflexi bacterium]|nr:transcriptional repressor LexA [Chloroflexota bacterium]